MIDVKRFEFDFFSMNPRIINTGNKLRVITSRWRACLGLISGGYRYLEVNSYSEIVIYRRSAWFFESVAQLPFNEIQNIRLSKFICHVTESAGQYGGKSTRYTKVWNVYLVLKNQGGTLPLFQWEKFLGYVLKEAGPVPSFIDYELPDESDQEKDFNKLVSRFCELTGKPLSWD